MPFPLGSSQAFVLVLLLTTSALAANTSPLADAAEHSDLTALRALLKRHDDVNVPQPDGMTALHWAAHHGDLEAARILLQNKANIAATNRYGATEVRGYQSRDFTCPLDLMRMSMSARS